METDGIENRNIMMSVISSKRNAFLKEMVPHREILDLLLVYRMVTATPDSGFYSILLNRDMLQGLRLDEQEVYQKAKANTAKLFPSKLECIDQDFYVLTNIYHLFGAVAAFESDEIEKLAEHYENSFYILPSSVHEVFLLPDYGQKVDVLRSIVQEANRNIVKPKEVLSDAVYYYDYEEKRIRIAE